MFWILARDHPRACGENMLRLSAQSSAKGSPPRMRGKLRFPFSRLGALRITPAHAGKTRDGYGSVPLAEDHPRACGENPDASGELFSPPGSPPRMRGKQNWSLYRRVTSRITPAHAGKTFVEFAGMIGREDHPRACGENPWRWRF